MKYFFFATFLFFSGCQANTELGENSVPKDKSQETSIACPEPTERERKERSFLHENISDDLCFLKNEEHCRIEDACVPCDNAFVDNFDCQCDSSGDFWSCEQNKTMDRHIYSIIEDSCIRKGEEDCIIFPDPTRTDCMEYNIDSDEWSARDVQIDAFGYRCTCEPRSAVHDYSSGETIYYGQSAKEIKRSPGDALLDTYFCELKE